MRNYDDEYKDNARKYSYDFDSVLRKYMMRSFLPFLPPNREFAKALEMGCYRGEFTRVLLDHFGHLTVIEASPELVAGAQQKLGDRARFIRATFEEAEVIERYDAIFLMHTLEHLDNPIAVLKKINGWLSDMGRLFLVVPNANAASRQIAVKMGLVPFNQAVTPAEREHGHRKTYSFDTLECDVVASGLHIAHRGGIFFKALANFQFDKLLSTDIIDEDYLEGCYQLGMSYPDLCASIFLLCEKGREHGA